MESLFLFLSAPHEALVGNCEAAHEVLSLPQDDLTLFGLGKTEEATNAQSTPLDFKGQLSKDDDFYKYPQYGKDGKTIESYVYDFPHPLVEKLQGMLKKCEQGSWLAIDQHNIIYQKGPKAAVGDGDSVALTSSNLHDLDKLMKHEENKAKHAAQHKHPHGAVVEAHPNKHFTVKQLMKPKLTFDTKAIDVTLDLPAGHSQKDYTQHFGNETK